MKEGDEFEDGLKGQRTGELKLHQDDGLGNCMFATDDEL